MTQSTAIDLDHVARDLHLPLDQVARTVELLDEGNTVPFITRYRKDQTGGLDEEQIRAIQSVVGKARQLAERKATVLKTIEAQGKLTPELADQIQHAATLKRLEDLYLPYKQKKQTLATIARERGLEPLAVEIYEAHPDAANLESRAATYLSADKELNTIEDVLAGVRHLCAERFSENAELRGRLRRIFQRSGKIVCTKVEAPPPVEAPDPAPEPVSREGETHAEPLAQVAREGKVPAEPVAQVVREGEAPAEPVAQVVREGEAPAEPAEQAVVESVSEAGAAAQIALPGGPATNSAEASVLSTPNSVPGTPSAETVPLADAPPPSDSPIQSDSATDAVPGTPSTEPPPATDAPVASDSPVPSDSATAPSADALPAGRLFEPPSAPVAAPLAAVLLKRKKKKKKKVVGEHAFKDYYNFSEALGKVPPHRVLAINRGERAHAIRVRIEADLEAMFREAEQFLIGDNHPHAEFLRGCVRDSLTRLLLPSLEREIRRELTDRAEGHAVEVFIRNLRKLLLQPPTHGRRVLAIDPGFKSGSKMAALDEFGNVLAHGMIYVIGKDEEKRKKARVRLADMVRQHNVSVIAIGNGTGCRETEQLVADCLADELKDLDVAYVIVNEAGASIYSTSPLGREELPQYDALQRGAISIGRRLLDPLSEMVKIHPANLGVGLYQHDIKDKHLKDSLDAVVESCVNFVGVDVNSASPALLRYVSGMNALTARRVYEHRREHGPFKNREELKNVQGFGEQTFVQAAGFLKVIGGENPLDATWIHPESYEIARRVLEKLDSDVSQLASAVPGALKREEPKVFAPELQPADRTDGQNGSATAAASAADSTEQATSIGSASPGEPASSAEPEVVTEPDSAVAPAPSAAEEAPAEQEAAASAAPAEPASSPSVASAPAATASARNPVAEKAAKVNVEQMAAELGVGPHLLDDILVSFQRPGLDPRDSLPPPVFRRGIIKLEDLVPGMELSSTVLNVVDFGVFVDIGLSDSGLVHISRLADRFIRDPHEVVGVGDVLKVWVVDVDKTRRRVSLTAIPPGAERPQRPPRQERPARPPQQRQPRQPAQGRPPQQRGQGGPPPQGPPRHHGGGRRDQGRGRQQADRPKTVNRPPTKPKPVKPITKAMEEGKEPMRSFSDLQQLFNKKKQKPAEGEAGGGSTA